MSLVRTQGAFRPNDEQVAFLDLLVWFNHAGSINRSPGSLLDVALFNLQLLGGPFTGDRSGTYIANILGQPGGLHRVGVVESLRASIVGEVLLDPVHAHAYRDRCR